MTADPSDFYRRRVPAQWNRALEAQKAASGGDETAARTLVGMKAVNATIRVIVRGGAADEMFDLAIAAGRMSADTEAELPPFMTLAHDLAAFAVLERESGDSVLGFLGGMAGLQNELKLTAQRLENLAGLEGTLAFELTGEGGFALLVHFGAGEVADEPRCKIENRMASTQTQKKNHIA